MSSDSELTVAAAREVVLPIRVERVDALAEFRLYDDDGGLVKAMPHGPLVVDDGTHSVWSDRADVEVRDRLNQAGWER